MRRESKWRNSSSIEKQRIGKESQGILYIGVKNNGKEAPSLNKSNQYALLLNKIKEVANACPLYIEQRIKYHANEAVEVAQFLFPKVQRCYVIWNGK